MEIPRFDNPLAPPAKEQRVFRGEFDLESGTLNFVCHTKDVSFQEVKKGLIKLRDEINRQLELEMNCPFVQPAKAVPVTDKQKYYFAAYQIDGRHGATVSAPVTDLETILNRVKDKCNYHNVQYFEFEYEIMK